MISELFTYVCHVYYYYYKFEKTHLQGQRSFPPHHAVQIAYCTRYGTVEIGSNEPFILIVFVHLHRWTFTN